MTRLFLESINSKGHQKMEATGHLVTKFAAVGSHFSLANGRPHPVLDNGDQESVQFTVNSGKAYSKRTFELFSN